MYKQAFLEDTYNSAFNDELEKIAKEDYSKRKQSLGKSFMAGLDPTGTKTFEIAQTAKRSKTHRTVGVAGGLLGGLTLIPSGVTGSIGAVKGFIRAKGGKGGRAAGAWSGFLKGAVEPYKQVYHGAKASKALKKAKTTGKFSDKGARHIREASGFTDKDVPIPYLKAGGTVPKAFRGNIDSLHKNVTDRTINATAALGASAAIGGGSAYLQYGKGREIGNKLRRVGQR